MQPTRLRLLALIALIAAAVGWTVAMLADTLLGRYLPLPWSSALAVWLLAASLAMWGWIVRPRLARKPGHAPLPPHVAARTAALALAASRVGAGVAGGYAGVMLALLPVQHIEAAGVGILVALATALGGVGMAGVALWIEHMCRLPGDGDEEKPPATDPALGGMGAERVAIPPTRGLRAAA